VIRVLLVGNPTAQSGRNADRIERARALLGKAAAQCEMFSTLPEGRTIPMLTERLDRGGVDIVASMGGDGTFREVGSALIASERREEIAMGMLPTGTANDQGKSFGLESTPAALSRNIEVLLGGRETRLDAGRIVMTGVDGAPSAAELFFDSAGFGFTARVLSVRNQDRATVDALGPLRELYRDQLVYAGAFVKTFLSSYLDDQKFDARISFDGQERAYFGLTDLILKGTRVYAGAWVFDPTCKHDDGYFEVVPFVGKADWTSKALLHLDGNPITEGMLNTIGVAHSPLFRARSMRIELDPHGEEPVPAQIDGEQRAAVKTVELEVIPRALRLIV